MKLNIKSFIAFFKEIIIVVLGVLIAVGINNYKENYEEEKFVSKTLSAIENEIEQSELEVEKTSKKHLQIVDSIHAAIHNDNESLGQLMNRIGGIQSPDVKNIGLRFFISNKAELVEYDIISRLNDIENYTNSLHTKMNRMLDFLYENIEKKDAVIKEKFIYHLANVINSEQELLKLYNDYKTQ
ncbi:hypothetical protein M0D21_02595 [Aquimarina sp. D1M17]|uniref:hypothetical protein n=1 Tax=Aquimarina acroporae TaxID=2937283 RepID=UPI0020C074C0|nr:hypothetical protein [Aquimarina acroporae]MCK8520437.1 hypothetical protein [Aquimarina acroporae]